MMFSSGQYWMCFCAASSLMVCTVGQSVKFADSTILGGVSDILDNCAARLKGCCRKGLSGTSGIWTSPTCGERQLHTPLQDGNYPVEDQHCIKGSGSAGGQPVKHS